MKTFKPLLQSTNKKKKSKYSFVCKILGVEFTGNNATLGGAIFLETGSMDIESTTFSSDNRAFVLKNSSKEGEKGQRQAGLS